MRLTTDDELLPKAKNHDEALSICASAMTSGYKAADLQLCLCICWAIWIMLRRCRVDVAQLLLLNVLKPFLLAERPTGQHWWRSAPSALRGWAPGQ